MMGSSRCNAVSQQEKQMLFPDAYAQDRQAIAAAGGGDARATGAIRAITLSRSRARSGMSWFFGDEQKMRNEQMAHQGVRGADRARNRKDSRRREGTSRRNCAASRSRTRRDSGTLTLGYAYDDTDRLLAQDVQRTNIGARQGKGRRCPGRASSATCQVRRNARADRTVARLSLRLVTPKTLEDPELRLQPAQSACDAIRNRTTGQGAWALQGRRRLRFRAVRSAT